MRKKCAYLASVFVFSCVYLWTCRGVLASDEITFSPTVFRNVQLSELTPEEAQDFEKMRLELAEGNYESAFLKMRGFLFLTPEKYVPGGDKRRKKPQTCAKVCAELVANLNSEGQRRWEALSAEYGIALTAQSTPGEAKFPAQKNSEQKNRGWEVTMTQVKSPAGVVVFEDFLPVEQRGMLFEDRKRDKVAEGRYVPQFATFTPDRNFLVARLGTQVTLWSEGEIEMRPQAYLAVLETSREGALVWLASPESVRQVLVGNPLADARRVYVPTLKIGTYAEFFLDVYALADGALVRRVPLFTASWEDIEVKDNSIYIPIRWAKDRCILVGDTGIQVDVGVF